ncbi:hypothetical protein RND81_03G075900 [Saponaria officinalis]|uniref:Uncharacterized protein n=1 Tax=Saponaria officinalis TaxID=3572 RepID=A0AAW1M6I8_SAPOF
MAEDNHFLGKFQIHGFPPAPQYETKFDVCFDIDVNGILNVSTVELGTQLRNQISIVSDHGRLPKEEIQRMINEAEGFKAEDEEYRRSLEAKTLSRRALVQHLSKKPLIRNLLDSRTGFLVKEIIDFSKLVS